MEKRKVRFTMIVTCEYEIDLTDYQNMGSKERPEPPCEKIEDAIQFNIECIKDDPSMFLDSDNADLKVKYEILPE